MDILVLITHPVVHVDGAFASFVARTLDMMFLGAKMATIVGVRDRFVGLALVPRCRPRCWMYVLNINRGRHAISALIGRTHVSNGLRWHTALWLLLSEMGRLISRSYAASWRRGCVSRRIQRCERWRW